MSDAYSGRQQDFAILRQVMGSISLKRHTLHVDLGFLGIKNAGLSERVFIPFKSSKYHPLTTWQKEVNKILARERVVVENAIAKAKSFFVLRLENRMRIKEKLTTSFHLCVGLANFKTRASA